MTHTPYEYRDARGRLAYSVIRIEEGSSKKRFEFTDKRGRSITNLPDALVLYRLPEVLAAKPSETILITEGEKDVETLRSLGYIATTNPGGCGAGWSDAYSTDLSGRHVIIFPDNDKPGLRHAVAIAESLRGIALSVVTLKLPRLRRAEDVTDWLARRRGTAEELAQRIAGMRYVAAGLSPGRKILRKPEKVSLILGSNLAAGARHVLLTVFERSDGRESVSVTAGSLAEDTGLHRVTVQRTLSDLQSKKILLRNGQEMSVRWDILAMHSRTSSGE